MVFVITDWEDRVSRSVHIVMVMSLLLDYGVPHDSVLGPVLIQLYTSDLVEFVRSFGLLAHVYHHHPHLFLKRPFPPRSAMVRRFSRYEAPTHIPVQYPLCRQSL